MNSDQSLQKLLDGAAKAGRELPDCAPFAVETRVLAHWRGGHKEDELASVLWFFKRAAIVAITIMMVSGVCQYLGSVNDTGTTALANYAMMLLPP
jgi:hypothetical protein